MNSQIRSRTPSTPPLTLAQARSGREYRVSVIRNAHHRENVLRMGVSEGASIVCVTNIHNGPVVVRYGRTDLAIGRGMAEQILVEPADKCSGQIKGGKQHGNVSPITWLRRWHS